MDIKITIENKEYTISELAKKYDIDARTIRARYNRGLSGAALIKKSRNYNIQAQHVVKNIRPVALKNRQGVTMYDDMLKLALRAI
jgi:hypothetical protein